MIGPCGRGILAPEFALLVLDEACIEFARIFEAVLDDVVNDGGDER